VQQLLPVATELGIALNHVIEHDVQLGNSLNDCAYNALFDAAWMKVGITPKEHHEFEGFRHDSGQLFADSIGLEDMVWDMHAKRWDQIDYVGNRYEIPFDAAMESPLFTNAGKRDLMPYMKTDSDYGMERNDWENPEFLSRHESPQPDEYTRKVQLWDWWLPRENIVVTVPNNGWGRPLRVVEWDGPERGPYHMCGLNKVPGNVMPVAPAMLWEDMNDLVNRLALKAGQQADRQKVVLAGMNRTQSTMESIIDTPDGMAITTEVDPNLIKEFVFGGVDANLMGSLNVFKDLFVYLAGNLDSLGGLSGQTGTIGGRS
jgi:hypothetical protein